MHWEVDFPYFHRLYEGTKADVLELMCGTGRLSLQLLEAGVRLWCVDHSPGMLIELRRKLRERGLAAEIREMNMRELDLGHLFELILLPFESAAAAAGFEALHLWGDDEAGAFAARRSPFMVWELEPA